MSSVTNIKDAIDPEFYLNRYPDLKNAYGNNHKAAIRHYMQHGVYEKRFFSHTNEELQKGIAANTTTSGEVYPYTSEYIKFTDRNTDPDNTSKLDTIRNTTANICRLKCNQNSECGGYSMQKNKHCTLWDTNVYPDVGMIKSKKTDFYMRKREMRKFCNAECMQMKNLDKLEAEFDAIIQNLQTTPERFNKVASELLIGAKGEQFYNELKRQEITDMSADVIDNVKKMYTKENVIKVQLASNYKRKQDHINFMDEYHQMYVKTNDKLTTDIDTTLNEKGIDARKTYYEDTEITKNNYYIDMFMYVYYAVFMVCVIVFVKNEKYKDRAQIILLVLFATFPYLMYHYLMYYIKIAYESITGSMPKNVFLSEEK
uniref:Apple domain-containing protein n=1 Tax=viral metagenome TaxID=1070528 RepID=A0A6C0LUD8_9ZZZZ